MTETDKHQGGQHQGIKVDAETQRRLVEWARRCREDRTLAAALADIANIQQHREALAQRERLALERWAAALRAVSRGADGEVTP